MVHLVVIVLVVAMGQGGSPATKAMRGSLQSALGAGMSVEVEERAAVAQDESPAPIAGHAEACVRWDRALREADIELRIGNDMTHRHVRFTDSDAPRDRGRTLGFVLFSMLPEPSPEPAIAPTSSPTASSHDEETPFVRAPTLATTEWTFSLDVLGAGLWGIGDHGASTSYGGGLAFAWYPSSRVGIHAAVFGTTGVLPRASSTTFFLAGKAGVTVALLPIHGETGVALILRADVGAERQSVSHFRPGVDDLTTVLADWAFVSGARAELEWRLRPSFALVFAGGCDVVFMKTEIVVRDVARATLLPARGALEMGMRVGF